MIPAIHPQQTQQMQNPALSQFNEGAASTANKVVAFVTALIASIASFFLLPFEGALLTSLGASMLASMFACQGIGREETGHGWLRTAINLIPFWGRTSQPVVQPGPRVIVGSGRDAATMGGIRTPQGVRRRDVATYLRKRHPNAVPVPMGVIQPQLRHHQQERAVPVALHHQPQQQQQQEIYGQDRIHVGYGHDQRRT